MNIGFAKELYEFEWKLRDHFTNWLQTPMTTLTVLGAAMAYLVQYESFHSQVRETAFYCTLFGAAAAWAFAVYCIARSFWGYTYQKLPRLFQAQRAFFGT